MTILLRRVLMPRNHKDTRTHNTFSLQKQKKSKSRWIRHWSTRHTYWWKHEWIGASRLLSNKAWQITRWNTVEPVASLMQGSAFSGAQAMHSTTCSCSRSSALHSLVATTHTRTVCNKHWHAPLQRPLIYHCAKTEIVATKSQRRFIMKAYYHIASILALTITLPWAVRQQGTVSVTIVNP